MRRCAGGSTCISAIVSYANCLVSISKHDEAEPLYREALEVFEDFGDSGDFGDPDAVDVTRLLAACLEAQGRLQEAESLLHTVWCDEEKGGDDEPAV